LGVVKIDEAKTRASLMEVHQSDGETLLRIGRDGTVRYRLGTAVTVAIDPETGETVVTPEISTAMAVVFAARCGMRGEP
jgi:hypothetical protein